MAERQTTSSTQERPRSEVMNEKLGNFKKFASTSFTRAKQFTIEKIGKAESVTAYDDEFDDLYAKVTQIKSNTEKILSQVDSMVQPNPGIRIETMVYSRLDRQVPYHSSPHELLSVELSRSGNEFGPETQYGGYLVRCGEVERKIGLSEKKYQEKVNAEVIVPLRSFLEVDIKNVLKEHKTLYVKRLDLDSCRNDVKKVQQDTKLQQAETALRAAQAEYDSHLDLVRDGMRMIVQTHVNNHGRMKTLMSSLKAYYIECIAHLDDIDTGVSLNLSVTSSSVSSDKGDSVKAKVLYDFDATEEKEVSVLAGQVFGVKEFGVKEFAVAATIGTAHAESVPKCLVAVPNIILIFPDKSDDDYYMAQVDSKFGFIPTSYIDLL